MTLRTVLSSLLLILAIGPEAAPARDLAPAGVRRSTTMVTMPDGVQLATDIWLPKGRGPFPTLVKRTPYGRRQDNWESSYAEKGYAVVIQDVRGRHGSGGEYDAFLSDGWGENQDGLETVEWAAAQSWSTGSVCVTGASAPGITSYLAVGAVPDHLVCSFLEVATGDLYDIAVFQGGAFRQEMVTGWLASLGALDIIDLIEEHPTRDDYWDPVYLPDRYAEVNVPVYHRAGWWDPFLQGNLNAFHGFISQSSAREDQYLVIGPWTHGGRGSLTQGELTYPANSSWDVSGDRDQFLEYYLKGSGAGLGDRARVAYYLMGDVDDANAPGNVWRSVDVWPPPSTPVAWYLQPNKTLSQNRPTTSTSLTYNYDPEDPVPTTGGNNLTIPPGPYDQSDVENRPDVLVFTSAPLTTPVAIAGPVTAHLVVSSSALDTDFTVKLTDVYPDGRSMSVVDGILKMRFREGVEEEVLMDPGEIYDIDVDLWSTAIVFNKGHQIRVVVSSSNDPRFEPNPNTGEDWHQETGSLIAQQTLYLSGHSPSYITFPTVPLP